MGGLSSEEGFLEQKISLWLFVVLQNSSACIQLESQAGTESSRLMSPVQVALSGRQPWEMKCRQFVFLFQEEKEAADAKLLKLKLQAKAKLASLNKRIEELTEKGSALPMQASSGEQVCPKVGSTQLLRASPRWGHQGGCA